MRIPSLSKTNCGGSDHCNTAIRSSCSGGGKLQAVGVTGTWKQNVEGAEMRSVGGGSQNENERAEKKRARNLFCHGAATRCFVLLAQLHSSRCLYTSANASTAGTTRLFRKNIKKIISLRSIAAAVMSPRQPGGSCSGNFRCYQPPSVQHDRNEHGCGKRIYCDARQGPFADAVSAVKASSDPTNGRTCCCLALRQCEETWGRTQ